MKSVTLTGIWEEERNATGSEGRKKRLLPRAAREYSLLMWVPFLSRRGKG